MVVAFAAVTAVTMACNKSGTADRSSETTTTGQAMQSAPSMPSAPPAAPSDLGGATQGDARYQMATARIAGVRCQRQISCEQIGINKRFTSEDECARGEGRRTQDELKSTDCPAGIDTAKLQACLAELSKQDCSALVGSLQTIDACKSASLCM
jgi:hypothetical protein